jgi:hypothetical protein
VSELEFSRPVWIIEDKVVANLLSEGVYGSLLEWSKDGIYYKEYVNVEDYDELDQLGFSYELDCD